MRTKIVRFAIAAVALTGTAAVWALSTGSASAGTQPETVVLAAADQHPISGYASDDLVVDGVHKHLLSSQTPDNTVKVFKYDGTLAATLEPGSGLGVQAPVLSADSTRLYVALAAANEIVEYDAAKLTETARYPLGYGHSPERLAFAGGRLWFSYQDLGYNGHIGSLDLADGAVSIYETPDGSTLTNAAPILASSPAAPDRLAVLGGWGSTRGPLYLFDVSGGTANQLARAEYYDDVVINYRELLFSADASQIVIGGYGGVKIVSAADLSAVDVIKTYRFQGVDVTSGTGLLISERPDAVLPELTLYAPGTTTPVRQWDVPLSGAAELPSISDVAWEPGGGRAFAITSERLGTQTLWTLQDPATTPTGIELTAPATATRAATLTISGASTGIPAGAGLSVTRKDLESTAGKALPPVQTGPAGTFTITDKPPVGGKVSYIISYAGSATRRPSSATATVSVSLATPALTLNGNGSIHAYASTYSLTAHLGTAYKNRTIEIWADPWGPDANRLLKKATIDAKGNITVAYRLTHNTSVSAIFTGDGQYAARTVKSTVYTRPNISLAVSSHYKTAKIGSTSYYYFHRTTNPRITTTMTAYPKRKQKVLLEYYASGKWNSWKETYVALDSAGHSTYTLTGTHKVGVRYRVRSAYIAGTSGDNVDYTTWGSHKYFTFAK
ncbi:YncE family protein [Winogradskya humida]|uniref:Ig-like domain repeat protein n=1 Tax=Winogradskya humida TaxID=113566 RepID=A0ABQ3ZRT5_9ACTN|nr:hypothetical protein [Actinoplanes humidus]GIE21286.1 hypothetical protein Ahu01nite_043880 [Actinoplanes humidus]